MNKYTIYCTESQVKKSLIFGAELVIKYWSDRYTPPVVEQKHLFHFNNMWYKIPTAEEMIGWLEDQGFYFRLNTSGCSVEIEYTCILELVNCSRKVATIATIDAALEYLSNQKKK